MSRISRKGRRGGRQYKKKSHRTLRNLTRQQRSILAAGALKLPFHPSAQQVASWFSVPPSCVGGAHRMSPAVRTTVLTRSTREA